MKKPLTGFEYMRAEDDKARGTNLTVVPADKLQTMQDEMAALKAENLKLEALCDKTYVAKGADAYNHACEVLESWQEKRIAQGKEPGCQGSLCGGMEWLYAKVDELEKAIAQAVQPFSYEFKNPGYTKEVQP